MILTGYVVRNGQIVEDVDSEDELLKEFVDKFQNQLMLFVGDKPERDEDGFEEWYYTPNCIILPKHEWNELTWKDQPINVEIDIHIKDR